MEVVEAEEVVCTDLQLSVKQILKASSSLDATALILVVSMLAVNELANIFKLI